MKKPGPRIRDAREAKGWSQEELAEKAKVTQQTIAKIEGGGIHRSRFLPAIARALALPLEELDEAYAIENSPLPRNRSIGIYTTIPGRAGGERLYSEEPVYYTHRPEPLFDMSGFGLILGDNAITPIARTGDIIFCGRADAKVVKSPCVLVGKRVPELSSMRPIAVRASVMDFEEHYILERMEPPAMEIVPQADWEWIYKVYVVHFR